MSKQLMGDAVSAMLDAIEQYCDAYRAMYGGPVGNDYVFGPEIGQSLNAVDGLLNGELGSHDGGTLSDRIYAIAREHEISEVEVDDMSTPTPKPTSEGRHPENPHEVLFTIGELGDWCTIQSPAYPEGSLKCRYWDAVELFGEAAVTNGWAYDHEDRLVSIGVEL